MSTAQTQDVVRQSRIGKRPVNVPQGVQVTISGTKVSVKGPQGTLERTFPTDVKVEQRENTIVVAPATKSANVARFQGLTWALIRNMVHGVSKGFQASLDLYGVGYKAELSGTNLNLALGLSHPVRVALPTGVKAKIEIVDEAGQKRPRIILNSADKELLGQVAAKIRSYRPPEPYKGKGVRFMGEKIREKAGKAGAKGKK